MRISGVTRSNRQPPIEETVLVALEAQVAAVDHQLGAFRDAPVDIAPDLVEMLLGDQRTHVGLGIVVGADLEARDARGEALDQRVADPVAHRHRHRDRHAALAGRAVACPHQRVGRLVEIGVGHDDHVVLGTAQRLHPLIVRRARAVDVFADGGRADEADRADAGVGEDGVDRLLVAVYHVDHAGRRARLLHQLGEAKPAGWVLLRRLEDEGVAAGERQGEHHMGTMAGS